MMSDEIKASSHEGRRDDGRRVLSHLFPAMLCGTTRRWFAWEQSVGQCGICLSCRASIATAVARQPGSWDVLCTCCDAAQHHSSVAREHSSVLDQSKSLELVHPEARPSRQSQWDRQPIEGERARVTLPINSPCARATSSCRFPASAFFLFSVAGPQLPAALCCFSSYCSHPRSRETKRAELVLSSSCSALEVCARHFETRVP